MRASSRSSTRRSRPPCAGWATGPSRSRTSSTTSTSARPSKAPRSSSPSTCRSSIAPSSRSTAMRSIHYMGHVRMMGAIQPFLSGAISKTVNMPEAATAEEIEQVYLEGWKLGLKAIAIYRDNSKRSQPLVDRQEEGRRRGRRHRGGRRAASASSPPRSWRRTSRIDAGSRRSATRSPTSSTSPATRATSRSASIRTASPARSSSRWPRRARRSAGSWTRSRRPCRWHSSTACRCATS